MRFQRFIVVLLLSLLATLALIALLPLTGLVRAASEVVFIESLYARKERAAASLRGPRILVFGGSATRISFDSVIVTRKVGIPTVNFGTHAGVGLAYILDRAKRAMRPGDIVLVAPEYEFLQQSTKPKEFTIGMTTFYDRAYIGRSPVADWPSYVFGYGVIKSFAEAVKVAWKGVIPIPVDDQDYDVWGNSRGYTVARSFPEKQLSMLAPILPAPITADARQALREFSGFAAARHVTVFVLPLSLTKTQGFPGPEYERYLASLPAEYARLGLTMLGTPAMTFMSLDEIHDIPYHANTRGQARYTGVVTALLCQRLHCAGR